MNKKLLGIMALVVMGFGIQQWAMAGGCYMPRVKMTGTAKSKQAVYMRSMPCMEEGKTITTTKSKELMTISQESDGWYQLTRSDGTVGWIYYTRLVDINANSSDEPVEQPVKYEKSEPVKAPLFSLKVQKQLDGFVAKLLKVYPYQEDEVGNKMMHPGMEAIRSKLIMLQKNTKAEPFATYILEKLDAQE